MLRLILAAAAVAGTDMQHDPLVSVEFHAPLPVRGKGCLSLLTVERMRTMDVLPEGLRQAEGHRAPSFEGFGTKRARNRLNNTAFHRITSSLREKIS